MILRMPAAWWHGRCAINVQWCVCVCVWRGVHVDLHVWSLSWMSPRQRDEGQGADRRGRGLSPLALALAATLSLAWHGTSIERNAIEPHRGPPPRPNHALPYVL